MFIAKESSLTLRAFFFQAKSTSVIDPKSSVFRKQLIQESIQLNMKDYHEKNHQMV